jgi:type IV pilus assembly protein PilO
MTKNIQKNLIIILILIVGLSFVYINYVISPLNSKYQEKLDKIASVETKLADTKRKAMELPKLQLSMKNLENEVADLEQLLPREKEVPGLIRIVTKTAQKYQLKISNITPGSVSSQPNYNEIPFQMTIQGTYHSLAYFLNEIGQEARILSVKNINYSGTTASKENSNTISVNCTLVAYTFKG